MTEQRALDPFDLSGRVAVVTGGSRGLGREMALALAEVGADLVLVSREREALERTAAEARSLGFVNRVVVSTGPQGAWSRLERGELGMGDFQRAFEEECAEAGHRVSGVELMLRIGTCGPRPAMLAAIRGIRSRGLRVAALTYNWVTEEPDAQAGDRAPELRALFDVFVESSVVGLRKPDPRIYEHVLEALSVSAPEAM